MSIVKLFAAALVCVFAVSMGATAQTTYAEGTHYTRLTQPVRTAKPGKIELTEVFSYACGHCFTFEPLIKKYISELPEDVNFVSTHIVWDGLTTLLARALYTAEALKVKDKAHDAMFKAIHLERKPVRDEKTIREIFVTSGVDGTKFDKAFNSFGVNSMIRQADAKVKGYKISSTPQLVVNGTYVIEPRAGVSHDEMLKIADFLINKVRNEGG